MGHKNQQSFNQAAIVSIIQVLASVVKPYHQLSSFHRVNRYNSEPIRTTISDHHRISVYLRFLESNRFFDTGF